MIEIKEEIRLHSAIFFLYGFFGMAWVPRFPELKAFLGLTNGEFGSLITAGTFGALASLLSMGHVVHKYGVRRVLFWSNFAVALSLIVVVNISSSLVFLICNITFGFSLASFHLAANAHAFHIQKRTGGLIISRFHGAWAIGVVATSIISGAVSEFIPLNTHIEIVVVLCTFALIYALKKLGPALDYHDDSDGTDVRIRDIFKSFKVDWLVSFGLLAAVLLEWSATDWATIYTREEIGVRPALAAVPYIAFMSAMIYGRLNGTRFSNAIGNFKLIQRLSLFGSVNFIVFIWISSLLKAEHQMAAFIATVIAFAAAGFGCSSLAAAFYSAATQRSTLPNAVIVGQVGVVLNTLALGLKPIIAWVAQWSGSLVLALTIPAVILFTARYFAKVAKS